MHYFLLLICLILTACGGSSTNNNNKPSTPPPSNPPITGNWYKPPLLVTWQWQLSGVVNTNYAVDIYDIDLFDSSKELIQQLHNDGKKVICYFSAGSYENWRSDASNFPNAALGNNLDGWEGEKWLDIRNEAVKNIMKIRLDLAVEKLCDGVEPDNMDGYINNSGFTLMANDQLTYNIFIAEQAHQRNLSVGLKNDLDQITNLVDYFDFAVNEQCFEYNECDALQPFVQQGKAILNAEYKQTYVDDSNDRDNLCTDSINRQFSTLVLPLALDDSFRFSCF